MIDARDYSTLEELKKAMMHECDAQVSEIMMSELRSLDADISQMQSLTNNYSFINEVANLKRNDIYWKVDRIQELAKRVFYTALSMKNTCRLIPGDDI